MTSYCTPKQRKSTCKKCGYPIRGVIVVGQTNAHKKKITTRGAKAGGILQDSNSGSRSSKGIHTPFHTHKKPTTRELSHTTDVWSTYPFKWYDVSAIDMTWAEYTKLNHHKVPTHVEPAHLHALHMSWGGAATDQNIFNQAEARELNGHYPVFLVSRKELETHKDKQFRLKYTSNIGKSWVKTMGFGNLSVMDHERKNTQRRGLVYVTLLARDIPSYTPEQRQSFIVPWVAERVVASVRMLAWAHCVKWGLTRTFEEEVVRGAGGSDTKKRLVVPVFFPHASPTVESQAMFAKLVTFLQPLNYRVRPIFLSNKTSPMKAKSVVPTWNSGPPRASIKHNQGESRRRGRIQKTLKEGGEEQAAAREGRLDSNRRSVQKEFVFKWPEEVKSEPTRTFFSPPEALGNLRLLYWQIDEDRKQQLLPTSPLEGLIPPFEQMVKLSKRTPQSSVEGGNGQQMVVFDYIKQSPTKTFRRKTFMHGKNVLELPPPTFSEVVQKMAQDTNIDIWIEWLRKKKSVIFGNGGYLMAEIAKGVYWMSAALQYWKLGTSFATKDISSFEVLSPIFARINRFLPFLSSFETGLPLAAESGGLQQRVDAAIMSMLVNLSGKILTYTYRFAHSRDRKNTPWVETYFEHNMDKFELLLKIAWNLLVYWLAPELFMVLSVERELFKNFATTFASPEMIVDQLCGDCSPSFRAIARKVISTLYFALFGGGEYTKLFLVQAISTLFGAIKKFVARQSFVFILSTLWSWAPYIVFGVVATMSIQTYRHARERGVVVAESFEPPPFFWVHPGFVEYIKGVDLLGALQSMQANINFYVHLVISLEKADPTTATTTDEKELPPNSLLLKSGGSNMSILVKKEEVYWTQYPTKQDLHDALEKIWNRHMFLRGGPGFYDVNKVAYKQVGLDMVYEFRI